MARVVFAKAFRRHVDCPDAEVGGDTLSQVLHGYFERFPAVRAYVLDETGAVRKHVTVFVDSDAITDRVTLRDAVSPSARIDVFQALSGG